MVWQFLAVLGHKKKPAGQGRADSGNNAIIARVWD